MDKSKLFISTYGNNLLMLRDCAFVFSCQAMFDYKSVFMSIYVRIVLVHVLLCKIK